MIKAVIFDLDDTLVESRLAKWNHHKHVAKTVYNLEVTDEDMERHWGQPMNQLIENLYQGRDTVKNIISNLIKVRHKYPKKIFPNTKNVLASLMQENVKLGIVSATLTEFIESSLNEHSLPIENFHFIQGADKTDFHKPDSRVFDLIKNELRTLAIAEAEVVYVGDSVTDLEAALGAGFNFIAVTTGLYGAKDFKAKGAKYIISEIGELPDVIKKL